MANLNFKGSEKQIKWANDIVDKVKKTYEQELKGMESENVKPELLENAKILTDIVIDILSNLPYAWTASDVIDNMGGLERATLDTLGIASFGRRSLRIGGIEGDRYLYSDLKDKSTKKEFIDKAIEYLKNRK